MPLIPQVGRRSIGIRLTVGTIYGILSAGAVLMVVPLLLMLTGSTASYYSDVHEVSLLPRYLFDEDTLIMKYFEEKYSDWHQMEVRYRELFGKFYLHFIDPRKNPRPRYEAGRRLAQPGVVERIKDWGEFKAQLPWRFKGTYFYGELSFLLETEILIYYRRFLRETYGTIETVNAAYAEDNESIDLIMPPLVEPTGANAESPQAAKWRDWDRFRRELPVRFHMAILADGIYQNCMVNARYLNLERLNAAWGTNYTRKYDLHVPETLPSNPVQAADWEHFVRTQLPEDMIELRNGHEEFTQFLEETFSSIDEVNTEYNLHFASFENIPFTTSAPESPGLKNLWQNFVRTWCPAELLGVASADIRYAQWLEERFGSVDAVNERYHSSYATLRDVEPPCLLVDLKEVRERKTWLRWYFTIRNYKLVARYMLTHGRAFWNTFVLVIATLVIQMTVNPFAAYALSRFRLPYTYKILLFLLGTMAFPAAIGMVPNFLLLKELGLLNTYWALVLPGAANGFFIFLLKGFFDSLPNELFEISTLEGASSFWQFRNVVVPLSAPIFAVLALSAFNTAYGGFIWAFLVCQDERMWTVMVWLQQFAAWDAGGGPQGLMLAALTLAGIPTLIVFILCQRVIIRGIAIPQFK